MTANITALLLAGGQGSRMGGVDKGLQFYQSKPLAAHAIERLHLQRGHLISSILINVNRSLAEYEAIAQQHGATLCSDADPEAFAGPLAGFLAGFTQCQTPYLLTVPCDSPRFPLDLAQRLLDALQQEQADLAMAYAPEFGAVGAQPMRAQPVFCLMKVSLQDSLQSYMQSGGRRIAQWAAQHRMARVDFNLPQDDPLAFSNVNTLDELQQLESNAQ